MRGAGSCLRLPLSVTGRMLRLVLPQGETDNAPAEIVGMQSMRI